MGRLSEGVRVFGPGLLGCFALSLITLLNTVNANLADLRRDVAQLREDRAGRMSVVDFEAAMTEGTGTAPTAAPEQNDSSESAPPMIFAHGAGFATFTAITSGS